MTLIDHLIETGRVPDEAAGNLTTAATGSTIATGPTKPNLPQHEAGHDDAPSIQEESPAISHNSQRMDYNAASPQGTKTLANVYGYIRQSGIPSRLIDLVFLRVSQLNGCAYCIDMHSQDLSQAGVPADHLFLLPVWRETGILFDEQERAALAWAEAVTKLGEHGVPDSAFAAAAAVFSEKQLADLTIAIGLMGAYNRLAISFRATPPTLAA